jgi:predicted choloylglycine hydrolase
MEHITDFITDNTEALDLLWALARKFDWKVSVFTEDDIRFMVDDEIDDDEMKRIKASRSWRKMEEALNTEGMSCIEDAINEANEPDYL